MAFEYLCTLFDQWIDLVSYEVVRNEVLYLCVCSLCSRRDYAQNLLVLGYRLRKSVLNSDDNYFWSLANRCFPTEFGDLQRGVNA